MKFTIRIVVDSVYDRVKGEERRGLLLLREYMRLEFPSEHQPNLFGSFATTIDIPESVAVRHPDHFEFKSSVTASVDSSHTQPSDWEDWGSAGMMLRGISLSAVQTEQILKQLPISALRLDATTQKLIEVDK